MGEGQWALGRLFFQSEAEPINPPFFITLLGRKQKEGRTSPALSLIEPYLLRLCLVKIRSYPKVHFLVEAQYILLKPFSALLLVYLPLTLIATQQPFYANLKTSKAL